MNDAGCRIDEGDVWRPCYRPLVAGLARVGIHLDQNRIVTRTVKPITLVIDIEPVGPARGKRPMRHLPQVWQPGDQYHRGLADREKHPSERGIRHTPSRSPGQIERVLLASVEGQNVELRPLARVTDT